MVDHLVRAVDHYMDVNGNALAAAVTYFAFLSFFPVLALSFAIFGQVSKVYEGAEDTLVEAANRVLPGLVGPPNGIDVDTLQGAAPGIFSVGIVLTLYSGLRWLSGMRNVLETVFEEPEKARAGFVGGKLRDVLALMVLGSVLVLSVAVSGVATKLLTPILEWVGLDVAAGWFFALLAVVLGLAANTILFFAFFRLLVDPEVPSRSLWSGAFLGAGAFEVLKQVSTYLLGLTKNSEAFQAFGIALILLVWIYYFSRVVVLSAAWSHTAAASRAQRAGRDEAGRSVTGPRPEAGRVVTASPDLASPPVARDPRAAFAAGAAAMLALVAVVRRRS